jgi:hypothetical protein
MAGQFKILGRDGPESPLYSWVILGINIIIGGLGMPYGYKFYSGVSRVKYSGPLT